METVKMADDWINDTLDYDYPSLEAVDASGQVVLVTIYSLTTILAFVGNFLVILVLVTNKRSSRGLGVFLINLAVSDLTLSAFSIPFTYTTFMLGRWLFAPEFCPVVHFFQHLCVTSSVYTLTAIGMDRYYAIMSPLHSRWPKTKGAIVQVIAIWCLAGALSSPQLVVSRALQFEWGGEEFYDCVERWSVEKDTHEAMARVYMTLVFVVTFLLPLLGLCFTYASIALVLWKRSSPGNANTARDRVQLHAKIKVIKMLALVVVMFAICWLPLHIFNLLVHFQPYFSWNFTLDNKVFVATFYLCHWLAMANSFVNPIIYCFMSDNFWNDLKLLIFRCTRVVTGSSQDRGPVSGSFRLKSTSYTFSFRKNSGTSQGVVVQMRRFRDVDGNNFQHEVPRSTATL